MTFLNRSHHFNFLKDVFHKFYLVHSWILCVISPLDFELLVLYEGPVSSALFIHLSVYSSVTLSPRDGLITFSDFFIKSGFDKPMKVTEPSMLLECWGEGHCFYSRRLYRFALEVTQKTKTSMEVMVIDLGTRKEKWFWSFVQLRKRANHLVTYESGPSKTQVDCCLLRRNQRKVLKGIKVLPKAECFTRHMSLIFDFKIKK